MVSVSGMSVHRVQSTCKEDIMTRSSIVALALVAGLGLAVLAPLVSAEMPGVTATEIKIGHTNPYSGPASAYGTIGKAIVAYFKKVNDEGGINGRKIDFITYDDGYSPPKIGILYQNDDYGKDYVKGLKDGLGDAARKLVVMEQSYEVTDPTIDSQIVNLKSSGANVFYNITIPKFAVRAIKKAHDIGWKPLHLLNNVSSSLGTVLKPAGLEASRGLITALYMKEITDPQWRNDRGYEDWLAWMKKYYPEGALDDQANAYAYLVSQTLVQVLKQCGNDLSRENIMSQVANIKDLTLPLLLPGIRINTSATDFAPIEQEQLAKFDGERWALFGEIYDAGKK